jgi:hypothetical protein
MPYLNITSPTEEDFYFSPEWEARLTAVDSAGVQDIVNDPAYVAHLSSIDLEELRKYVVLP